MLHVILLILKIIGIVLAYVIGLLLLIVAAVLFSPIRYRINADYHSKIKANAAFSWLGILRGTISFDEELRVKVKALFFTLYRSDALKKEKKPKTKKKNQDTNVFSMSDEELHLSDDSMVDSCERESDNKYAGCSDNYITESDKEEVQALESEEQSKSRKNIFVRVKEKISFILDKIKEIFGLICDTVKKVKGAGDKLKEKVTDAKDFLTSEDNKELFHFLIEQLKELIRAIRPRKYRIDAKLGFEDPAVLGKVLMYISVFYGISGMELNIEPVFGEDIKEGSIFLKGRIRIISILIIALRVYRNKQFKKFISK